MLVKTKPDDVHEVSTDERGRITLGVEYANQDITVAVLEE